MASTRHGGRSAALDGCVDVVDAVPVELLAALPMALLCILPDGSSRGIAGRLATPDFDARVAPGDLAFLRARRVERAPLVRYFLEIDGQLQPVVERRARDHDAVLVCPSKEQGHAPSDAALAPLSEREREIVLALLQHRRVARVAKALFLSPHTVRNHLRNVFGKLQVGSQDELFDLLLRPSRRPPAGAVPLPAVPRLLPVRFDPPTGARPRTR